MTLLNHHEQVPRHAALTPNKICTVYATPPDIYAPASLVYATLALEVELGLAVRSERAPGGLISSLAVVADGGRLPWLVEGLEVEGVEAPVEQGAEAVLEEVGGVVLSTLGGVEIGANCGSR